MPGKSIDDAWVGDVQFTTHGNWHWMRHCLSIRKGAKNYRRGMALLRRVYRLVMENKTDDWLTYKFRAKIGTRSWGHSVVFRVSAESRGINHCDDMEEASQRIWELIEEELLRCSVEIPSKGEYLGETYYAFSRKGMSEEYLKKRNGEFIAVQ